MQFTFALEACIIHLEEEPWEVLFEKVPDYVDGLNTAEINRLAVAVGLPQIFECTDDVDDTGHDSRWVTVNDPAGRHPVVWKTWCRSFGRDEPNSPLKNTV